MNIEILLLFLGESLAKSIAILLVTMALVRLWRGSTAAQRHLVWLAAIVAVLLLPTMRLVTPRWTVPLERPTPVRVSVEPPRIEQTMESLALEQPLSLAAPKPVAPAWKIPNWRTLALGAWLGGAVLLLAYRLLGSWRLRRIEHASIPLDNVRIEGIAHDALGDLGITRGVKIRVSKECRVPMTWGSVRPVLLLPVEARQWTDAQLLAALRHEAGHISRWDYPARWLAHLACALYWPNPLMWLAVRSLRVAQEQATDDLVLRAGTTPEEYASQLFEAARLVAVRGLFARHAVAMASPSTLEDRVLAIVDPRRDRRPLSLRALVGGILAVALTVGLATAAQLVAQEKAAPPTNPPDVPKGPQIMIETRLLEITTKDGVPNTDFRWLTDDLYTDQGKRIGGTLPPAPAAGPNTPYISGVLTAEQYTTVLRALSQKKGADLLTMPRVTTTSGQRALIEVIREFSYPTEWEKAAKEPQSKLRTSVELEKAGGPWKSKASETRNVGVMMDVLPKAAADGTIQLQLAATATEFVGFIDLDDRKKYPPDMQEIARILENLDTPLPPVPPGHRSQPIFSERKIKTEVSIFPGQTVVIGGVNRISRAGKQKIERSLLIFVTAHVLDENASSRTGAAPKTNVTARSATYDAKTGTMKAEGDVKIETADATIRAEAAEIQPKKPASTESPAMAKARKIILHRVEFREATLAEALDFLRKKARDLDEEKRGINIVVNSGVSSEARLTLSLTDVPLSEALHYVAELADLHIADEGVSLILMPKAGGRTPASKAPPAPNTKPAPLSGPAYDKASRIIIPKLELRDATVNEAVHFLDRKAREIGEDKPDINVVLNPKPGAETRISLSLTNVPLTDALRYVAELAGLEMKAEPHALVLQPPDATGLATKVWRISAETLRRVSGTDESNAAVKAALIDRKVAFPEGSSLAWLPDSERLVIRNTRENLQRLNALIEKALEQLAR